jgi:methylthioribose-1-phosphate isomerase
LRPTAVNLMNNLDRMKQALAHEDFVPALVAEALRLIAEDKALCDSIAQAGSELVKPGSRLLTHCNTGGWRPLASVRRWVLLRWPISRARWRMSGWMRRVRCCRAGV